ncbi:hypothetical protein [Streptococcus suis]|uniref:hypothetical protein n=1 Tax=Streptococcus suis TaxID=1307 RepID=UPI00137B8095|nr:hypothetical protein [Streptococcus suis]
MSIDAHAGCFFLRGLFSLWFEVIIKNKTPDGSTVRGFVFYYSMKIKSSLASTIWEIVEGWKYSEHCLHLQVDVRTLFLLYFKVTG